MYIATQSHLDNPRVAPLGSQVVPPLMPKVNNDR